MPITDHIYINQATQDEHRKENGAKAVDNYVWDADNLVWVRQGGNAAGGVVIGEVPPTSATLNNPSLSLGYTGNRITTITETINGVDYQQTVTYDGDKIIGISESVQL